MSWCIFVQIQNLEVVQSLTQFLFYEEIVWNSLLKPFHWCECVRLNLNILPVLPLTGGILRKCGKQDTVWTKNTTHFAESLVNGSDAVVVKHLYRNHAIEESTRPGQLTHITVYKIGGEGFFCEPFPSAK